MRTLVLNAGYEPVRVVSWEKAMILLLTEKAELISGYDRSIRSARKSFILPRIIKLKRYLQQFTLARSALSYSRLNVFKRDAYLCQYCHRKLNDKTATIDHIIPRSRGGQDTWTNTVCCCVACNSRKGDRTPDESQMKLLRKARRPQLTRALQEVLTEFEWNI